MQGTAAGLVTAGTAEEWFDTVAHWTQALSNVSLVEFVLLAALTTVQWIRHRIRGAGGSRLSFAILGALSLTVKIDPSVVSNQTVAKVLIVVLLLMPYCLFRFAASFRTPSLPVRVLAAAVTAGIVGCFTFALRSIPVAGHPEPPHFLAYRVAFVVAFGFLFSYVVVRLFIAGRGEPPIVATRMRLLAVAVAGLEVQVVVSAFGLGGHGHHADRVLTVAMGLLLLAALVLPSLYGSCCTVGRTRRSAGPSASWCRSVTRRTWPRPATARSARWSARPRPRCSPRTAPSWRASPCGRRRRARRMGRERQR